MKQRTFKKPTTRQLLNRKNIEYPGKINERYILKLLDSGILINVGDSYRQSVEAVEQLPEGCFALFPSKFVIPKAESDYGIKSLDDLVKIDSQQVLRTVSGQEDVPTRLTREFARDYHIWPYTLIKTAMRFENIEKPPIGFYWIGSDNRLRATTWIRAITGAEMQVMKQAGVFDGKIIDRTPYGRNLRVKVSSRTEENEEYEFTLARLPMHKRGDPSQYFDWINLSHNSPDPDASYRGEEHDKRAFPVCFWSASAIFSFYDAMKFVSQHKKWKQFRINPFPIPTNQEMIDYTDRLRLDSFILRIDEKKRLNLDVLNKTEIDRQIGARTILRRYDDCWHHWGKKDLSFLYHPE